MDKIRSKELESEEWKSWYELKNNLRHENDCGLKGKPKEKKGNPRKRRKKRFRRKYKEEIMTNKEKRKDKMKEEIKK